MRKFLFLCNTKWFLTTGTFIICIHIKLECNKVHIYFTFSRRTNKMSSTSIVIKHIAVPTRRLRLLYVKNKFLFRLYSGINFSSSIRSVRMMNGWLIGDNIFIGCRWVTGCSQYFTVHCDKVWLVNRYYWWYTVTTV